jgi:hypothetical protein
MQPTYITFTSTGVSPWKIVNSNCTPQEISFAVLSTGGSSYVIDVTLEDPTNTFPSPNSSLPTPFTIFSGVAASTGTPAPIFSLGSSTTVPLIGPIYAYRFSVNTLSSVGARVTLVSLQDGIG